MNFAGQVVLITGAAGALGQVTARQFAAQGARLALDRLQCGRFGRGVQRPSGDTWGYADRRRGCDRQPAGA
jgi:NAD(P)-dependent dehydrogenase (short-subunit alcohol dehydrogenase family)